jgi:hypothetical protein
MRMNGQGTRNLGSPLVGWENSVEQRIRGLQEAQQSVPMVEDSGTNPLGKPAASGWTLVLVCISCYLSQAVVIPRVGRILAKASCLTNR